MSTLLISQRTSALRLVTRIQRPAGRLIKGRRSPKLPSYQHFRMLSSSSGSSDKSIPPPTTTMMDDRDDADLIVSHFQNRMVHRLWSERAKAKKERGTKPVASNAVNGKTPSESQVAVEYPFTTNEVLAESYRSPWNTMRIGRLLEDLDALAGNIAFYHVRGGDDDNNSDGTTKKVHPLIVTASVDRIRLRQRPSLMPCDQVLSGRVTYVGTSSMEICMTCTETNHNQEEWLEAYFTFVTLDPVTKKPMSITPLLPETDAERRAFEQGKERAKLKKERRKRQKQSATSDQNDGLKTTAQQLLQQARPLLLNLPSRDTQHAVFLSATHMQNALIAQPQVRNLHHRIFGGYLMRRAFELAFSTAYVFGGARPQFVEVDEISFAAPVDVGDLLLFNSRVLYTSTNCQTCHPSSESMDDHVHVEVEAWVTVPEQANAKLSNQFYFTFAIDREQSDTSLPLRRVLPANMDEAMRMASRMEADQAQALEDSIA